MLPTRVNCRATYNCSLPYYAKLLTVKLPSGYAEVHNLLKPVHWDVKSEAHRKLCNASSTKKLYQGGSTSPLSLWIIKELISMRHTMINNNRKSKADCFHFPRDLLNKMMSHTHKSTISFPFVWLYMEGVLKQKFWEEWGENEGAGVGGTLVFSTKTYCPVTE